MGDQLVIISEDQVFESDSQLGYQDHRNAFLSLVPLAILSCLIGGRGTEVRLGFSKAIRKTDT